MNAIGHAADMPAPASQAASAAAASNPVAPGQSPAAAGRTNTPSAGSTAPQRKGADVEAGAEGMDAATFNQLNTRPASMSQSIAGRQSRIDSPGSQLQTTQRSVRQADKMACQGIAAATALTMLPQVEPGKTVTLRSASRASRANPAWRSVQARIWQPTAF
ncbi:hypothetical protein [Burkholderia sp. Ac-20379]|uniref:hypothetical protein n=1 Tax=Burkholderia sp. Ac-20379 TaxID=2703900 RepID=UPI0030DDC3A5